MITVTYFQVSSEDNHPVVMSSPPSRKSLWLSFKNAVLMNGPSMAGAAPVPAPSPMLVWAANIQIGMTLLRFKKTWAGKKSLNRVWLDFLKQSDGANEKTNFIHFDVENISPSAWGPTTLLVPRHEWGLFQAAVIQCAEYLEHQLPMKESEADPAPDQEGGTDASS